MTEKTGTLYIVSTPIGNLKDMTYHAVEVLKQVDLIAAEDTRHTKILTSHYQINTPMTSYFEHNKFAKARVILENLQSGKDIALVSDAGTPGICDPGYRLVQMALENNIPLRVVPGASAIICALVVSGRPTDKFMFCGFLPPKTVARKKKLEQFKTYECTLIFYESVHRIVKSLHDIKEVYSDIEIVVVRELTKKFEEVIRDKVSGIIKHFENKKPKGEFVIVV